MSVKTFAAIDVGSFELTMKIFDLSGKNTMREIDCIRQRIDLGSDTYAHGKISNEKIDDLCHTLKEFAQIMESYKVTAYKAYGTSAIRETENTLILQDQIEQRTGIWVETLSNSEQRFLDYKSIASKGETFRRIIEEKTAILDIGGGSIQISLFDKDTLVSTQNLRLGVLRLQELLNHLNAGSTQMERLVDELATAQLDDYKKLYLKDREIKNHRGRLPVSLGGAQGSRAGRSQCRSGSQGIFPADGSPSYQRHHGAGEADGYCGGESASGVHQCHSDQTNCRTHGRGTGLGTGRNTLRRYRL